MCCIFLCPREEKLQQYIYLRATDIGIHFHEHRTLHIGIMIQDHDLYLCALCGARKTFTNYRLCYCMSCVGLGTEFGTFNGTDQITSVLSSINLLQIKRCRISIHPYRSFHQLKHQMRNLINITPTKLSHGVTICNCNSIIALNLYRYIVGNSAKYG